MSDPKPVAWRFRPANAQADCPWVVMSVPPPQKVRSDDWFEVQPLYAVADGLTFDKLADCIARNVAVAKEDPADPWSPSTVSGIFDAAAEVAYLFGDAA